MSEEQLNAALNLMRRMPPAKCTNSLYGLIELAPDLQEDLLHSVDQPLKVTKDSKTGKDFIECDYNRDGDSFRSPWSNQYFPPIEDGDDGYTPSAKLREMEKVANHLFDVYRKQYFDGGYSSVYFFETEDGGPESFGSCWLVHKDVPEQKTLKSGWWDSTHIFSVTETEKKGQFKYNLITTVMISMNLKDGSKTGDVDLSGSMTKQQTVVKKVDAAKGHIQNMGTILEEMELRVRNSIEGIYIQKTREVISGMRSASGALEKQFGAIAKELNNSVAELATRRKQQK